VVYEPVYLEVYHPSGISGNLEMSGNLAEVSAKSGKRPKVRERSGNFVYLRKYELCMNCDVHGHVLRSPYNLPVLYAYCN